ncbi:hypothetical protein ACGGZK_07140 [Agromyces sp. MMS24-K17]|uniref:hypothetical protein n=1 Tax=Agromyces sp. MMS24-K17 TaxID=3372850 RepID=UPI003754E12D
MTPVPARWNPARQVVAVAAVLLVVGGLAGCAGEPAPARTAEPTAEATAEPIFASDEEALAAAVEAYEAYNAEAARISTNPAVEPSSIANFVSEGFVAQSVQEFELLRQEGVTLVGEMKLLDPELVMWSTTNGAAHATIYVCLDVSGVRVVNSSGADVTAADRQEVVPQQAEFISSSSAPSVLLVDRIDQWSGADFCSR